MTAVSAASHDSPIPRPVTSLIGRESEIATIIGLFRDEQARLVTLTGPGGIGKTRLSLESAIRLEPNFADGVRFADLSTITVPDLVLPALAAAIGVSADPSATLERLIEGLRAREQLLVIDNFEQVIAAAPVVAAIIQGCPGIRIIVTSRALLRVSGEFAYAVPPLGADPAGTVNSDAISLFVARARAAKVGFTLAPEHEPVVVEICRQLDGLPLAIELAAARVNLLAPPALLTRLSNRLQLLNAGQRDRPVRQQTLRDAIAWSHDLLSPAEQTLFQRLAVFAGGCPFDAIDRIASLPDDQSKDDSLDLLASLVDKSLVRQIEYPDGATRFGMLETIRDFATERLALAPEQSVVRDTHLAWLIELAEETEPCLVAEGQQARLESLEREIANIRAGLTWAVASAQPEAGLRLAASLGRFWEMRGHASEGRDWLDRFLNATNDDATELRARGLAAAGRLTEMQGEYETAAARFTAALTIWRKLGDQAREAQALSNLGGTMTARGDYAGSAAANEQALAIYREIDDAPGMARVLLRLGGVAFRRGDDELATRFWSEGLDLQRHLGDLYEQASFLNNLGLVATRRGQLERAQMLLQENLVLVRQLGDRRGIAIGLLNLSQVAHGRGESDDSESLLREAAEIFEEVGDRQGRVTSLSNLGTLAFDRGDTGAATRLYQESLALAQQIGDRRSVALGLGNLGGIALTLGDLDSADLHSRACLALYVEIGDQLGTAQAELRLGHVLLDRGDPAAAQELLTAAFARVQPLDAAPEIAGALHLAAQIAAARNQAERAVRLFAAAAQMESVRSTVAPWERTRREAIQQTARHTLGDPAYAAAWTAGQALERNAAIALALSAGDEPPAVKTVSPATPFGLTPRELDVLRLVVEGRPDREIAEELFLSPRTVGGHVTNILNKLGVNSRSAATALAVRQGIV